jgi:hypothetical protein
MLKLISSPLLQKMVYMMTIFNVMYPKLPTGQCFPNADAQAREVMGCN